MGTMSRYSLHGLSRKGEGPTGCSYPRLSPSGIWRLNIPALFCVPLPFCPYSCFSFHLIFSSQHQPPPLCLCLSWFVMFSATSTSCLLFLHPLMSASLIMPSTSLLPASGLWSVSILTTKQRPIEFLTPAEGNRRVNVLMLVVEMLAFFGPT